MEAIREVKALEFDDLDFGLEEKPKKHRPQDDVPTELIIHYIVKDYRRMFERERRIKPRLQKRDEKIRELTQLLRQKQIEALPDEKQKKLFENLINIIKKLEEERAHAIEERDASQTLCERLSSQIDSMRESRNAIVEDVTSDLREKLDAANEKIKLLAQAISNPEQGISFVHTIETDDDKKWMVSAIKQLEEAAKKMLTTEERLNGIKIIVEQQEGTKAIEMMLKKLSRALGSIDSTISHIECFMDKVGDIKIK